MAARLVAVLGLCLCGTTGTGGTTHAAASGTTYAAANTSQPRVLWLRADPLQPRLLFAGGTGYCHAIDYPPGYSPICPPWLMRSRDGGATWQDLGSVLSPRPPLGQGHLAPPLFSSDGQHLYLPSSEDGLSADSGGSAYFTSADNGNHWQGTWSVQGYGVGITNLAVSPVSPRRLYAVLQYGDSAEGPRVAVSARLAAAAHQ